MVPPNREAAFRGGGGRDLYFFTKGKATTKADRVPFHPPVPRKGRCQGGGGGGGQKHAPKKNYNRHIKREACAQLIKAMCADKANTCTRGYARELRG